MNEINKTTSGYVQLKPQSCKLRFSAIEIVKYNFIPLSNLTHL